MVSKNTKKLNKEVIKSAVLISDDWVSKFPKSGFRRRIGQQISRWSCLPSAVETLNYIFHGKKGIRQEVLKTSNIQWQRVPGEQRFLMPYDSNTVQEVYRQMGVSEYKVVLGKKITEKLLKKKLPKNFGWLLFFHRFSFPKDEPSGEINHATVFLGIARNKKVSIFVPYYNKDYDLNKNMVFEYKDWNDVVKRIPTHAVLIGPHKKGFEKFMSKIQFWWL